MLGLQEYTGHAWLKGDWFSSGFEYFLMWLHFLLEWVDTVWELDFTETEPLDSSIEAQIIETELSAFTNLYESLFPFATEECGYSEVKKKQSS